MMVNMDYKRENNFILSLYVMWATSLVKGKNTQIASPLVFSTLPSSKILSTQNPKIA